MVLSDKTIKEFLKSKRIIIRPFDEKTQLQPSSVDLTLGSSFRVFKHTEKPFIDPKNDKDTDSYTERVKVNEGKYFIIHPREFVLGSVLEHIELPDDIVARLDGRSSIGRMGVVVHSTAGFVDPGYRGKLTLEITNLGKVPVALYPGMRICQISFQKLSSKCETPYNKKQDAKYLGDDEPKQSRIAEEF
jgi:dCTP deaminase